MWLLLGLAWFLPLGAARNDRSASMQRNHIPTYLYSVPTYPIGSPGGRGRAIPIQRFVEVDSFPSAMDTRSSGREEQLGLMCWLVMRFDWGNVPALSGWLASAQVII